MAKITMGIDASTKSTGISIFEGTKLAHYECLTETNSNVYKRIVSMVDKMIEVYKKWQPTNIIMEEVLPEDVKGNQQVFKSLIYLQGLFNLKLNTECGFGNLEFYVSSHWRKKCGIRTGRNMKRDDLKKAAMEFVKSKYKIEANDDICDAICIGYVKANENASAW